MRLLRWLLLLVVLILAAPAVMLAFLATESGTAWTLGQARDLVRPLGIEFRFARSRGSLLRRLELQDLVLAMADSRFEAERVLLQWHPTALFGLRLHIRALEIADARLVPPPPTDAAAAPPEIPELVLPLEIQLDRLLIERLAVEQPDTDLEISRLALAARLDRQGLALRDLSFEGGGVQLQGALGMQAGEPHELQGELSGRVDHALTGDDVGTVEARAELSGTVLSPVFDLMVSAPAQLKVSGLLKLDQVQPAFDLSADWPGLSWPLQGPASVTLQAGQLTLKGVADNYRLDLQTRISGEGIPLAELDATATGDMGGLKLLPLKLAVLDGQLEATGSVRWDQGVSWDLAIEATQINPGVQLTDWPGDLGGRVDVAGSLAPQSGELTIRAKIHDLAGRLRDYPVSASGSLDYRAGQLHAQAFEFASGPNRLKLDGHAGDRLDLGFDIKAPELASLYPGLSGSVEGAGQLKGTRQAPLVVARLSGQKVAYQELEAQDLKLDLDWRENGGKGNLQLSGLDVGDIRITRLSADLDGSPESHRLNLAVESPVGSLGLGAQGGVIGQVWEGELQRLNLAEPSLGEWLLQAPARLNLGADKVHSSRLCLAQAAAAACAEGGWDAAKGLDFSGNLAGLELARLTPHLPGDAVIEGQLRGDFRVNGTPASPNVQFELIPGDGLIRVQEADEPLELAFRNARISGRFENDRGNADLHFELGPNGRAQGHVLLGPDEKGERSLGGEIDADFPDLGLVAGFVPELQQVVGRLHMEAVLGGTLAAPRLTGALEIADARAQVPAAGIELSDVGLLLRGDGEGPLSLRGQLQSGEGRLDINGTVDMAAPGGNAVDLTIQGENVQAVKLPEATVQISPDLRLQGAGPYHLSGRLLIPKAAIELKEVPSGTVDVSDDEIIIGADAAEEREAGTQNLTARVRIELGKAVTFEGFGLETGLTGVLDAAVDAGGTSLDGKIELRDGEYKAYGQDLKVERGRLLFAGPPGNPEIDLRAVRVSNNGEVKAYLALTGPLSKPRPRIFSEPALSETEALAYLVTGRGLDQAGSGGNNIAGAALSMGLSTADPLIQQLTGGLGLDEITVVTGEEGLEDSSVTLGKYLNPDLYVGYSQGIFNPEGAVLMRLRLREKLTVESRSGNEQSVDLFYRIEHD